MSLSVSSFPEPHSKLTSKRWFFGGRLNTSGALFMKGIRHISRVQLKSGVPRFTPKPSQNSRPTRPPRLSVRASAITIDIIAVPHVDRRQSFTDTGHDTSIPDRRSWYRRCAVPLPKGISARTGGAASGTVGQPCTRVNLEAARAARGDSISPSPSWRLKTKGMGPVPNLPVFTVTPADAGDPHGSPSSLTYEKKNELLGGDSSPRRRDTLRRALSSPSLKHRMMREQQPHPPPPSPSPIPLLSVHIAPMRSGSRPSPSPLPPLFANTRTTTPTLHRAQTALQVPPPPLRRPTEGSPPNLPRSRSQPLLRTAAASAITTKVRGVGQQPILSRSRSPLALAEVTNRTHLLQPCPAAAPSAAQTPETPRVRACSRGGDGECRPRTAPESGGAARSLAPAVATNPWAAMGAAGARQWTTPARLPYGPR